MELFHIFLLYIIFMLRLNKNHLSEGRKLIDNTLFLFYFCFFKMRFLKLFLHVGSIYRKGFYRR